MIKRDHVNSNPAAKIEEIMLGEYEPHVLTVDEATQFLEITRRESPALLTPVAIEPVLRNPAIRSRTFGST